MFSDVTAFPHPQNPPVKDREERRSWLPGAGARLLAFYPTRRRFPLIGPALSASLHSIELSAGAADGVIGWGDKPLARMARAYAKTRALPYWTLEDGFLRSVGLGKEGAASVSIVADDLGIHFSARTPSRLEMLLQNGDPATDLARARSLRQWIVRERLSKYNHLPEASLALPVNDRKRILLVDQVAGDRSIVGSGANAETFLRMWSEAWSESNADIIVKSHPDIVAGKAEGYLTGLARRHGVQLIDGAVSPHSVLDLIDEVWTVSSQLGFDALLRKIPVVTFGVPAYAGWGLTHDRASGTVASVALGRRTRRIGVDELVHAALIRYPLYVDPVTRETIEVEQAVERLLQWRKRALSLNGEYLCVNFARHKHKAIGRYLKGPWSQVSFARKPTSGQIEKADRIVVWGNAPVPACSTSKEKAKPIIRVEDGFIRSAGLGSSLVPPSSLCLDAEQIYFDATRPNGLESLLARATFDKPLIERARRLRQAIVAMGITKYNLPEQPSQDYLRLARGRKIVLVAGQVPDDASLRYGMPSYGSNIALLRAVRRLRPYAFIIYKEHPDILSGNRAGRSDAMELFAVANLVIGNADLAELLQIVDEVHVATSQIGFEALLREREVWCHGLPFYAGWGLTHDTVVSMRRKRILSLDALVAGALILYPSYWSSVADMPCEVEDVVRELYHARKGATASRFPNSWSAYAARIGKRR